MIAEYRILIAVAIACFIVFLIFSGICDKLILKIHRGIHGSR